MSANRSMKTNDAGNTKPAEQAGPFEARGGAVFDNGGRSPVQLANFDARILVEEIHDDGCGEPVRIYVIAGITEAGEILSEARVPASEFASMGWVAKSYGADAVLMGPPGGRERLRQAILLLSANKRKVTVYAHTGWRELDGRWVYLHGGGAIGSTGPLADIEVRLPDALARYELPAPPKGEALAAAIRSSLRILDLARDPLTFPNYGLMLRSALGEADFAGHIVGESGAGKSEFASLIQQHFGPTMDRQHLPASWTGTANSIEVYASLAGDAILVVDDFVKEGGNGQADRQAERVFRAQGNRTGRSRMGSNGVLNAGYAPNGIILSTGEDFPRGFSLRSRVVITELGKDKATGLKWDFLTACQTQAKEGAYAAAFSGYVRWLAGHHDEMHQGFATRVSRVRTELATDSGFRRTNSNAAGIIAAWDVFLEFAQEDGGLTADEAAAFRDRARAAMAHLAREQAAILHDQDPVEFFMSMIGTAVVGGHAHFSTLTGGCPVKALGGATAWGWTLEVDSGNARSHGNRIGFIDGQDVYLHQAAAFAAARAEANRMGRELAIEPVTLWKRMNERGLIVSREEERERLTVRKRVNGRRLAVLHIRADSVFDPDPDGGPDGHAVATESSFPGLRGSQWDASRQVRGDDGDGGDGHADDTEEVTF